MAYLNLQSYDLDDPFMRKVKGIYRKTWLSNQLIERTARQLVQTLGVDVVLLKGLALTLRYYQSHGARPMEDFDVLVRLSDLERVIDALAGGGGSQLIRYRRCVHPISMASITGIPNSRTSTYIGCRSRKPAVSPVRVIFGTMCGNFHLGSPTPIC